VAGAARTGIVGPVLGVSPWAAGTLRRLAFPFYDVSRAAGVGEHLVDRDKSAAKSHNAGVNCCSWLVRRGLVLVFAGTVLVACGDDKDADEDSSSEGVEDNAPATTEAATLGTRQEGQYHLGPVDFAESEWHNACAPLDGYRTELRTATGLGGEYIAGVSGELSQGGGVCDACILITTATERSIVARVVTYGVSNAPGDLDVSPSVYAVLNSEEYPRTMSWQFSSCPDSGNLSYEFQTEANVYWTSLWVRNPKQPLSKVEVQSANHQEFFELRRGTDGTLTDDGGFGEGAFTLRLTALDGQVISETFDSFEAGALLESEQQFE
jgi:expansin